MPTEAATTKPTGLALLREPIPAHLISTRAKGTKQQEKCADDLKVYCEECRTRHALGMQHFDFVGHAAVTDILLEADPAWYWEPMALDEAGLPRFDAGGGLWIRLTVCGVTRLGFGNAQKRADMAPGDREKEVIGDALRNAAMRFGVALSLWARVDLHGGPDDETDEEPKETPEQWRNGWVARIKAARTVGDVRLACLDAVKEAQERGDKEASGYFYVAEAEMIERAERGQRRKQVPPAPQPTQREPDAHIEPVDFDESEFTH